MAKAVLNTKTDINISGSDIEIYTYYSEFEEIISAFIMDEVKNINGVSFIEGEEGYTIEGYPDVSFFINDDGEFIVQADDPDKFAINSDGQLTITE